MTIKTPSNLELLLHYYVSADRHPRHNAPAIQEGIHYLHNAGMIEETSAINETYQTTDMGTAYIEYIMSVPFPVIKWVIPDKDGEI